MNEKQQQASRASQELADMLADSAKVEAEVVRAKRVAAPPAEIRRRNVRAALIVAVPILVLALTVTFAWDPLMSLFEPTPSPAEAALQAQKTLEGLVAEIESFRKDYNELPATLVDVGMPPRGEWGYATSGSAQSKQYTVTGKLYGQVVTFDSAKAEAKPLTPRP
jgi:hypothetical protein